MSSDSAPAIESRLVPLDELELKDLRTGYSSSAAADQGAVDGSSAVSFVGDVQGQMKVGYVHNIGELSLTCPGVHRKISSTLLCWRSSPPTHSSTPRNKQRIGSNFTLTCFRMLAGSSLPCSKGPFSYSSLSPTIVPFLNRWSEINNPSASTSVDKLVLTLASQFLTGEGLVGFQNLVTAMADTRNSAPVRVFDQRSSSQGFATFQLGTATCASLFLATSVSATSFALTCWVFLLLTMVETHKATHSSRSRHTTTVPLVPLPPCYS